MNEIGIVVCLHGNEPLGLDVIKKIDSNIPTFVGNPLALKKNVRFLEVDMNRCFPGKINGKHEEKEACNLLEKVKGFKYLIDIHSSSCNIELFGILTKPNKEKVNLAKKMGLKKIVIMKDNFAKGLSLIDHLNCAISIEVGPHARKKNVSEIVEAIQNLSKNIGQDCSHKEIDGFEIFDIIPGDKITKYHIKNFEEIKKNQLIAEGEKKYYAPFNFFPIFVGEDAYKGIICMAAKKVVDF